MAFICRNLLKTRIRNSLYCLIFLLKKYTVPRFVSICSGKMKLSTLVLSAGVALGVEQNKPQQIKLQAPDPSTLTQEYLLRTASILMVDSVSSMLTQTTVALSDALTVYAKTVWVLVTLMEYRLKILNNPEDEAKLAELILEARDKVNKAKEQKQNLEMLMSSVDRLVTTAAEVSYMAGAEYASSSASEKLQSVTSHLRQSRSEVEEAEAGLLEMQINVIEKETQASEKTKAKSDHSSNDIETASAEIKLDRKKDDGLETKDIFEMSDDNNS